MNALGKTRFVAVEFDTHRDTFDPCDTDDHIAINIDTVRDSINTTCLPSSTLEGTMTATITFNSSTNMLLASMHLDDNPSNGSYEVSMHLPDPITSLLPPEVEVGFSAAAGSYFEYHQILSWSFDSTLTARTETSPPAHQPMPAFVVTGKKIGAPEGQPKLTFMVSKKVQTSAVLDQSNFSSSPESQPYINSLPQDTEKGVTTHSTYGSLMIGVAFLGIIMIAIVIWISVACYKHRHQEDFLLNGAPDSAKRFEYRELVVATDKFSKKLGEGGFGIVYEGKYKEKDGQQLPVAVKKLNRINGETKDFHAELNIISETRHKNLIKLKGWCSRNRSNFSDFMCWWRQKRSVELFLVFELVRYGSLDVHLNDNTHVLPWARRYNIVKDIGTALRYLHHECDNVILHRDIKPGNILLDENFVAKLADFGLSRIAHKKNETAIVQTIAMGTKEYMDPKCIKNGIVTFRRHSDVYSFGLVLLEIACTGKCREEVWVEYNRSPENMAAMADARLKGNFDYAQMKKVAVLGLWCSLLDERQRPSLQRAMEVLELDTKMPDLRQL